MLSVIGEQWEVLQEKRIKKAQQKQGSLLEHRFYLELQSVPGLTEKHAETGIGHGSLVIQT
jgi:hypothetical protein